MSKVAEIFTPGRMPRTTYNPRAHLGLETLVKDYIDGGEGLLSISGPTKTGKTTLIKHVLPDAVWISGSDFSTLNELWMEICGVLEASVEHSKNVTDDVHHGISGTTEGGLNAGIKITTNSTVSDGHTQSTARMYTRKRSASQAAKESLRATRRPVVIDDFHYVPAGLQKEITRAVKDLVFDGVPIIFASVPHRAYDALTAEAEMTGRFEHLEIPYWDKSELRVIPEKGFPALNVIPEADMVSLFVDESYGSPHLMQAFCLDACKNLGVTERNKTKMTVGLSDRETFFRTRARKPNPVYEALLKGPTVRGPRKNRRRLDGGATHIYEAVLAAIAMSNKRRMSVGDINHCLRKILVAADAPQNHEITRVLNKMDDIAKKQQASQSVIDFHNGELYVLDPFFVYHLKWHD